MKIPFSNELIDPPHLLQDDVLHLDPVGGVQSIEHGLGHILGLQLRQLGHRLRINTEEIGVHHSRADALQGGGGCVTRRVVLPCLPEIEGGGCPLRCVHGI